MWDMFEEIEQAGERCGKAAANVKASVYNVFNTTDDISILIEALFAPGSGQALETLKPPAKEATEAFEYVRDRIVPRIDAIQSKDHLHKVAMEMITICGAMRNHREIRSHSLSLVTEHMKQMTQQMREGLELGRNPFRVGFMFNEIVGGIATGYFVLPKLSTSLHA